MTRERLFALHTEITTLALEIMKDKNRDYSPSSDPLANFRDSRFLDIHPYNALLLRCLDKFRRIRTFTDTGRLHVKNEPVQDAIRDVINYMVLLAAMVEDDTPLFPTLGVTGSYAPPEIVGPLDIEITERGADGRDAQAVDP